MARRYSTKTELSTLDTIREAAEAHQASAQKEQDEIDRHEYRNAEEAGRLTPYARAYRLIEEATPDRRAHVLHVLTGSNPEARRLIIALLDPDEVMLAAMRCHLCDSNPCACYEVIAPKYTDDCPCNGCDGSCPEYEEAARNLNDEPTMAGEVTGYDNGPTFW